MLLAGEGRDRPAFLSESSGEVHGAPAPAAAPRTDIPAGMCLAAQGGSSPDREQPPTGGTFKRMDRNPGTPLSSVIPSTII